MLQALALWNPSFTSAVQNELEAGETPVIIFNFSNVDSNNYPSTRSCILRGFLFGEERTNVLTFTTDKRSTKYKDLLNNPRFDACFYFKKTRKQYRFKGTVKMISDDLTPNIVYESPFQGLAHSDSQSLEDVSDPNDGNNSDSSSIEDESQSLVSQYLSQHHHEKMSKITDPLHYKVFSPAFLKTFEDSSVSLSELGQKMHLNEEISKTPTKEEWQTERLRVWNEMPRSLKKTFKKPIPGTPLTEEKRKLLDAINRGVDGSNSSTGYENFVTVCMFVELVDEVVLGGSGYDRRYLYRKTNHDVWKEYEVCP
jgi:pyridoxamine 5'-phosphate oxidase